MPQAPTRWVGPASTTFCADGTTPALAAFDLALGGVQWSYCSTDQAWRSVLGATDQVVYLNSITLDQTFELTALDAKSGAELWRRPLTPPTELGMGHAQGPFAAAGVVVLKVNDGSGDAIVGVDAGTGAERWRSTGDAVPTPIANTEEVVVVGGFDGLRGLDRATGVERWTSPMRLQDDSGVGVSRGSAAVTGNTVIVPAGGNLVAIDADTGQQLWQAHGLRHPSAWEGFVVGYLGQGPSQKVTALDAETGATLWTAPGRPSYGDLWAIGGGTVSVLDPASGIVAYELATGEVRWRRDDPRLGEPRSAEGDAVFVLWDSYLAVLSSTDGSIRWEVESPLGSTQMNSLGINSGSLFVSVDTLPPGD